MNGNGSMPPPRFRQGRPTHFISRGNGLLVPLIPADELPPGVRLRGLPFSLQLDQTHGMQHVATIDFPGPYYQLEGHTMVVEAPIAPEQAAMTSVLPVHTRNQGECSIPAQRYLVPDTLARQHSAEQPTYSGTTPSLRTTANRRPLSAHERASNWRSNAVPSSAAGVETQAANDAINSAQAVVKEPSRMGGPFETVRIPSSGAIPDQDKKEYCTYCIKRGECDYIQQGCLYKHEMPDRAKLAEIGINSVPRWWVEKHGTCTLGYRGANSGSDSTNGRKESLRPVLKSGDWLKKMKATTKSTSTDSGDDAGSSDSDREDAQTPVMIVRKPKAEPSDVVPGTKQNIANGARDTSPGVDVRKEMTKTAIQTPETLRKASTTSDLIDFPVLEPTLASPSPSSSTSSGAIPPSSNSEAESKTQTKPKVSKTRDENSGAHSAGSGKRELTSKPKASRGNRASYQGASAVCAATKLWKGLGQEKAAHAKGLMASKFAAKPDERTSKSKSGAKSSAEVAAAKVRRPAKSGTCASEAKKEIKK